MHVQPRIRSFNDRDTDAIVRLSLRAWAPVFPSIERAIGPEIYGVLTPDWRASQQQAVEAVCAADTTSVWVTEVEETPVAFVAVELRREQRIGEISMLAVDPDYQGRGIGSSLTDFALDWIKGAGMRVAMVETGADPGHAAARRTYDKTGFTHVPIARYFKKLQ